MGNSYMYSWIWYKKMFLCNEENSVIKSVIEKLIMLSEYDYISGKRISNKWEISGYNEKILFYM